MWTSPLDCGRSATTTIWRLHAGEQGASTPSRSQKALSLTQREMKREPQHKGRLDRHIRIMGLTRLGSGAAAPAIWQSLRPSPTASAAAAPKTGVVRCPIPNLEFHLPEMMPAISIVFVRHQNENQSVSYTDQPSTASRCPNATHRCIRATTPPGKWLEPDC